MTVYELVRKLLEDGWTLLGRGDSPPQFHHLWKAGRVTLAGQATEQLCSTTERIALRQAGLVTPPRAPPLPPSLSGREPEGPTGDEPR